MPTVPPHLIWLFAGRWLVAPATKDMHSCQLLVFWVAGWFTETTSATLSRRRAPPSTCDTTTRSTPSSGRPAPQVNRAKWCHCFAKPFLMPDKSTACERGTVIHAENSCFDAFHSQPPQKCERTTLQLQKARTEPKRRFLFTPQAEISTLINRTLTWKEQF